MTAVAERSHLDILLDKPPPDPVSMTVPLRETHTWCTCGLYNRGTRELCVKSLIGWPCMVSEPHEIQSDAGEVVRSPPQAEPRRHSWDSERFRNISLGIAGVVSSVFIPVLGIYYTSRDKDREVSKGFVEIATKILSDNPTDSNKPLREWAISLIDNYSAVRLPEAARTALLNKQSIFGSDTGVVVSRATLQ